MPDPVDRQAPPSREQRDRATKVLDAAYGDGQITLAEYEQRVRGVREADNAWRLERWVDDLQLPASLVPSSASSDTAQQTSLTMREFLGTRPVALHRTDQGWWHDLRRNWRRSPRSAKVTICALLLAGTGVIGGAIIQDVTVDEVTVVDERVLSSGLGEFRDAFEDEFDTTVISNLQIDPDYVRFEVLVTTDPPRSQVWAWQDDSFSKVGPVSGTRAGVVDLADIDAAAVDAALRSAVPELRVEDPSEVITIIRPDPGDAAPQITLLVRNDFEETGRLVVGPEGEELRREPFTEPGEE